MPSLFSEKVFEKINEYSMLDGVKRVIVALSGGADSMSLLYFLSENKQRLGVSVAAAHLNHNLRGEESMRDEAFVRKECEKLGIELFVKSLDIASLAASEKIGLEECGRRERYRFFDELREGDPQTVTATAHTASDNAETVLFNLTRGCGIDGLCGIPPVRGGIIRPLIGCTRAQVEEYCFENGVPFITDSTNLSDEYNRNKLRLNVIPQLKMINPSAENAINRLSAIVSSDCALIDRLCANETARCTTNGGLLLDRLRECDEALLPHIIKKESQRILGVIPEKKHTDLIVKMIADGRGAVELRQNKAVRISNGVLMFADMSANLSVNTPISGSEPFEIPLRLGMDIEYNGAHYYISDKIAVNTADKNKINKKLLINRISCGIISVDTKIRNRRSGDVFSPYGRGCTKTVKKLFTEMKLPLHERQTRLLIANGSEVLWIDGIGVSQQAAVCGGSYFEVTAGGKKDE